MRSTLHLLATGDEFELIGNSNELKIVETSDMPYVLKLASGDMTS